MLSHLPKAIRRWSARQRGAEGDGSNDKADVAIPSVPRPCLAEIGTEVVLRTREAQLDGTAESGGACEFGQRRPLRCISEGVVECVEIALAAVDEQPAFETVLLSPSERGPCPVLEP